VTFTLFGLNVSANVTNGTATASFTVPAGKAVGTYPIQAVYAPAGNFTGSSDNTKQLSITKAPPVITAVSVSPSSGSGANQTFALQYVDPLGATDLSTVWVWINASFDPATPSNTCLLEYATAANQLYLCNDAGTGWLSPASVGAAGTLSNSQCSINMAAASVTTSGTNLTLNLPMTFTAGFAGAKNTYMYAGGSNRRQRMADDGNLDGAIRHSRRPFCPHKEAKTWPGRQDSLLKRFQTSRHLQRGEQVFRLSDPDDAPSPRGGASALAPDAGACHDSDPFLANLNSTIEALRNVTFVVQKEQTASQLGMANGRPLSKIMPQPSGSKERGPNTEEVNKYYDSFKDLKDAPPGGRRCGHWLEKHYGVGGEQSQLSIGELLTIRPSASTKLIYQAFVPAGICVVTLCVFESSWAGMISHLRSWKQPIT
jgi:hypothetical protein